MKPMLIEESTLEDIPSNLEVLLLSLGIPLSSANKNDILVVLLYVLMMETGFLPQNVPDSTLHDSSHSFSINTLRNICKMPSNWKNTALNLYELPFVLGRLTQYPCKLLVIPTGDVLIANLVIPDMNDQRKTYSMTVQSSKYIKCLSDNIPASFKHLKDLSLKFKNSLSHPARSVILTREGILNSSLLGLPDEIKIRIFKNIKVNDLLRLSTVCKDLYCISQDQGLWRYFLLRDFNSTDVQDLVNQPNINDIMVWKEEYKRKFSSQRAGRRGRFPMIHYHSFA